MKRGIAFFLSLLLILSTVPGALAAPVRDVTAKEIMLEGKGDALLETVMSAAVLRGVPELKKGEAPPAALWEGALTMGLYRGFLGSGGVMTAEQMSDACKALFTTPVQPMTGAPECPCITVTEQGWTFDFSSLLENPAVGVHVYDAVLEGEEAHLRCDLYLYSESEYGQPPEFLAEAALTWLCGGEVTLRCAPETLFGFTVSAYRLTEDYAAGALSEWRTVDNTEYEYSVNLPQVLGLCDETPACMAWETADGSARLTVQGLEQDCTFEQMLEDFIADAGNETVSEHREIGSFTAVGDGIFEMYYMPEGLSNYYVLTMIFPEEKQEEYTLYAEFIRNSFTAWEAANG